MKVKDVIVSALYMLGRNDTASKITGGGLFDAEESEMVDTLVYCFNSVEDEVARKYMPLSYRESLISTDGKYSYTTFTYPPVKIKRVFVNGVEAEYQLYAQYMLVNAVKIEVEYEFAPRKKQLDGTSDFGDEAGEYLLALGSAAEYCLINGEIEAAELWESKYRKEIDGAQQNLPSGGYIPPRRWQ